MGVFTRFSLRNPVVIFLFTLFIIVGGVFSSLSLKEELMPNIAFPVLAVVTGYPGASPQSVAMDVTDPLENALKNVSGVQTVTSSSVQNVSEITLELTMSANLDTVQQKVEQLVSQVPLPTNAMKPNVQKFSFDSSPVVNFTVASKTVSNAQLRTVVNQTIIPALQGVPGVASVQTGGAVSPRVNIQFDAKKLSDHNLSMQTVIQDLQAANVSTPLGSEQINGKNTPLQLDSPFQSLQQIRDLQIPIPPNQNAAMQGVGQSMQKLGQSVSKVAAGVSGVGKGLGLVQAENSLLSALQQIQGQLFGAELGLAQQQAMPASQRDPAAIAKLQGAISALQQEQQKLQNQLNGLQNQAKSLTSAAGAGGSAAAAGLSGGSAGSSAASGSSAANGSSSGGTSGSSGDTTLDTVPLSDLATVTLAPPSNGSINRTNGQPSVFVGVVKTENANTVDMAKAVNTKLTTLQKQLPKGVSIVPLFDSSTMIKASVNGMIREAVLGALFAVLVILLFLRNWRTTVIAVVSIPLSLLIAIIVLNRMNVTMNIMTLGGMAVATGRVVDDSIVVIENIFRAWRRGLGFGRTFVQYATREVGHAITSSTLTTVAVFLPLGFVSGVVGKIFLPFAITVVCALLSSLLVALTVVPTLAWLFVARRPAAGVDYASTDEDGGYAEELGDLPGDSGSGRPDAGSIAGGTEAASDSDQGAPGSPAGQPARAVAGWQRRYQGILRGTLNHKGWVLGITLLLFLGSLALLPSAGTTFIPASKEKFATISVTMPTGTPRDVTDTKAKQVEQVLKSYSSIQKWNTQVGSDPGRGGSSSGSNTASLFLELQPDTKVDSFLSSLRTKLKPISAPAQILVKSMVMGGSTGGYSLTLTGPKLADVKTAANEVTNALKTLPGLTNVTNNLTESRPQVTVIPDPKKAAEHGLTAYQLSSIVSQYVRGRQIGTATIQGQSRNVWVSVKPASALDSLANIRQLKVDTPTGSTVKLSDVADVQIEQVPVEVAHQDGQPYASVTGDFTTSDTGKTSKQALARVKALSLPSDVQVSVTGSTQEQNKSFKQLIEAILISVGLVYIVMLLAFGEWSAPFAILFSMPVALIGAIVGTILGKQPISVSSLIGILMLMGIVVTNAIVLVDRVEQQRKRGLTVREALLEAGTTRLRPILMTAIATICSLVPLAIGFAEGALISQGLAMVVIGGLVSSTVLTLLIVPVMYELLNFRTHRREQGR